MLERLLTSRVRVRLLTLFFTHPTESFYIRQISRLTGETYNNVRQELKNLSELGLISSERRANSTYYVTNKDHFLFSELKKIVYKTEALGDALKEKLSDLGDIQVAFIYGSTATGTEFSSSDIDLMIIGTIDVDLLEKTIEAIEEEIDRTVNYTLFNTAEWHERVRQGQSFVLDVSKNPKIFLMGTEDDLRSIAEIGSD